MHNYTRFEETDLDTVLYQFHRSYNPIYEYGYSYEYLGIVGHAANHVDFFKRPGNDAFFFGNGWNPYLQTPDREVFFNTKKPYTEIAYTTIPVVDWREETISALHTQNINPYTNIGFKFNILSGKQLYTNEDTRSTRLSLFGSHAKDRYTIFGTFQFNDFKVEDHGGLENLNSFLKDSLETPWSYPMMLENAKSQYRNWSFFLTQKYNLFEAVTTTDSTGVTETRGKTFSLAHQLHFTRDLKTYRDVVNHANLAPIYDTVYYMGSSIKDSVTEDRLSNVFQLIIGDPYKDRLSARAYAGYNITRYGNLYPDRQEYLLRVDTITTNPLQTDSIFRDTVYAAFRTDWTHDVFVGFHMAGPTAGLWDWVIDGKYYLAGYYQNNFNATATFSRILGGAYHLGLRGTLKSENPHYLMDHYSSAFFEWNNDFKPVISGFGELFINESETNLDIRFSAGWISDFVYWNQDALPVQYDKDLLILSGSFQKHFILSGFNSDNRILLQYTTGNDILRLPLAALYSSNYWLQSLFKGALIAQLGFDVYYTTKYYGNAYMPATGVFYLQDKYKTGGYPFLDLFFEWRISRTRFFVSWNNLLSGPTLFGNNFFTTYDYPMKPRNVRFGLVWTFYD